MCRKLKKFFKKLDLEAQKLQPAIWKIKYLVIYIVYTPTLTTNNIYIPTLTSKAAVLISISKDAVLISIFL